MKTIVYIDGLNFYYGCLKGTPYKWLDFKKLVQRLTRGTRQIVKIKYFASPIRGDALGHNRQKIYWRALEAHIPDLHICEGLFKEIIHPARLANQPSETVSVMRFQEKKTDVNIAVNLLDDAWTDSYECAIVISNDSDLEEALSMVRLRYPQKHLTVLPPIIASGKRISRDLTQHADSVIKITEADLAASQLPDRIPGTKSGTKIQKPKEW